jgi:glycosyltransferase involved in cell wall biosynthesis
MESGLNAKYDFRAVQYRTEIGSNISSRRIYDLYKQIRNINPDIAHISGLLLNGFHMALACRLARVKRVLLTVHGTSRDSLDLGFSKKQAMVRVMEPLTLAMCDRFYGVSSFLAKRDFLRGPRSAGFVYNLPPSKTETQGLSREKARERLGINKDAVVLVSVGRIVKDKGYHILADALLERCRESRLKVIIVGEGAYSSEMKASLRSLVEARQVSFLGYRADVLGILAAGDIFVLPSLHETLSIALLEASACGLALIASNAGGIPEIVKDGFNGILVPPGDTRKLSAAIRRMELDSAFRTACGRNAPAVLESRFSRVEIENAIDRIYMGLLTGEAAPEDCSPVGANVEL